MFIHYIIYDKLYTCVPPFKSFNTEVSFLNQLYDIYLFNKAFFKRITGNSFKMFYNTEVI